MFNQTESQMRKSFVLTAIAALALAATASSAMAGPWARHHPRRAEVNGRLRAENARIVHNYRQGNITADEARSLHSQVHGVRLDERADASLHNGHISKSEQRSLNQDENSISRQIYDTAHD